MCAVRANAEFVPPYGSGGSLYIRPFLMGSGPILGLQPCSEFSFVVSVVPVGNYFGTGGVRGIHANVMTKYDRAAPRGTGNVKAGGNYAASSPHPATPPSHPPLPPSLGHARALSTLRPATRGARTLPSLTPARRCAV